MLVTFSNEVVLLSINLKSSVVCMYHVLLNINFKEEAFKDNSSHRFTYSKILLYCVDFEFFIDCIRRALGERYAYELYPKMISICTNEYSSTRVHQNMVLFTRCTIH